VPLQDWPIKKHLTTMTQRVTPPLTRAQPRLHGASALLMRKDAPNACVETVASSFTISDQFYCKYFHFDKFYIILWNV
jgi:hypothetical protein